MSKITNDRLNPVWHKMLYSCTHTATVGVKGLTAAGHIQCRARLIARPITSWLAATTWLTARLQRSFRGQRSFFPPLTPPGGRSLGRKIHVCGGGWVVSGSLWPRSICSPVDTCRVHICRTGQAARKPCRWRDPNPVISLICPSL